jgi:hypothetical protein
VVPLLLRGLQVVAMHNFIHDLLLRTKLILRYNMRLLGAAAIHLGLSMPNFRAVHTHVRRLRCFLRCGRLAPHTATLHAKPGRATVISSPSCSLHVSLTSCSGGLVLQ